MSILKPFPAELWRVLGNYPRKKLHFKFELASSIDADGHNFIDPYVSESSVDTDGYTPPLPHYGELPCFYTFLNELQSGTYYWRVTATDNNGFEVISEIRAVIVQ